MVHIFDNSFYRISTQGCMIWNFFSLLILKIIDILAILMRLQLFFSGWEGEEGGRDEGALLYRIKSEGS